MSWSFSVTATPFADFETALKAAADEAKALPQNDSEAIKAQIDIAVETATHIAVTEVVAGPSGQLRASLSGHVQQGEGSAMNVLNISVSAAPPEPAYSA